MEIRKLFGQQESAKTAESKKKDAVEQYEKSAAEAAARRQGEDVVSLSPLSRQLLQISNVVDEDGKKRAERVADLKKRIEDGSYSVSSDDVARSLVSYAADQTPLREF